MKIKGDFCLRTIDGDSVAVPIGTTTVSFRRMITLNGSGAFLWRQLQDERTEEDLLDAMLRHYDIDAETARTDIAAFLRTLEQNELLE